MTRRLSARPDAWLKLLAVVLWLASLAAPAILPLTSGAKPWDGLSLLLLGWLGVLDLQPGWLANLLGLVAMLLPRGRWAVSFAAAALLCAFTPLARLETCGDNGCVAARPELGLWLWLTSAGVLTAAAWLGARGRRRTDAPLSPHPPG